MSERRSSVREYAKPGQLRLISSKQPPIAAASLSSVEEIRSKNAKLARISLEVVALVRRKNMVADRVVAAFLWFDAERTKTEMEAGAHVSGPGSCSGWRSMELIRPWLEELCLSQMVHPHILSEMNATTNALIRRGREQRARCEALKRRVGFTALEKTEANFEKQIQSLLEKLANLRAATSRDLNRKAALLLLLQRERYRPLGTLNLLKSLVRDAQRLGGLNA